MSTGKLWEANHPYYATTGCFYVGWPLGHRTTITNVGYEGEARYDGATHHANYASWADFKAGICVPFTPDEIEMRLSVGLSAQVSTGLEDESMYHGDLDLDLLYRWDWCSKGEHQARVGEHELALFFMAQRKAYPTSVLIRVTKDDEPEIRAWLWPRWCHLLRLWAPLSGWPIESDKPPLSEALEHVGCAMADASWKQNEAP